MAKKEKKIVYYSDYLHDDFAVNKIKTKKVNLLPWKEGDRMMEETPA